MYKKPPIGVLNKHCYNIYLKDDINLNGGMSLTVIHYDRFMDLKGAIERYLESNLHIDIEWINEYNETLTKLGVKENKFKL